MSPLWGSFLFREKYNVYYGRKTIILKEMFMMNVIVKHVVEIAVGVFVGTLANEGVNKVVDVIKEKVKNSKKG